jgi:hypothetical protein
MQQLLWKEKTPASLLGGGSGGSQPSRATAPPPSTASTLAAAGGHRRANLTRLTAVSGLCLLTRPGAAGASPPSATRSPAGAAHRPRTPCSSGGAGHQGSGPGTLDGWAARRSDLGARAYGRWLSAPGTASASVDFVGVRGGLWRCLVGGRFGAVVFISAWCG